MIVIERTNVDSVLLIKPDKFEDFRGSYVETYNEELYKSKGIDVKFIQDDISDPELGIWWPTKAPILSRRDEEGAFVE